MNVSILQLMNEDLGYPSESPKQNPCTEKIHAEKMALYVASNLKSFETDSPDLYDTDLVVHETCYRKLEPVYYAWLRHKYILANKASQKGKLSGPEFEKIKKLFQPIRTWAINNFGEQALRKAVSQFNPRIYSAPVLEPEQDKKNILTSPENVKVDYLYPSEGEWTCSKKVSKTALKQVGAIKEKAIRLGWSENRLYQNRGRYRFPYGEDYGLVCYLGEEKQIGEIALQHIEIISNNQHGTSKLKFYNPDLDLPFRKKIKKS